MSAGRGEGPGKGEEKNFSGRISDIVNQTKFASAAELDAAAASAPGAAAAW
jgi:hypothetical protein